MRQLGISVWITYDCQPQSEWDQWGQLLFAQMKSVGANSVALLFPLYTDAREANTISAELVCGTTFNTPPPAFVAQLVVLAHAAGLAVFLRPLLDERSLHAENPNLWRGNIKPSHPNLWFQNYRDTLRPYLKIAQKFSVEHFAISSELSSMDKSRQWVRVRDAARAIYKHNLVFTHSWRNSYDKLTWGMSGGLDTYPHFPALTPTSSVRQILAAWDAYLRQKKIPKVWKWGIDEVGIPAQDGAYASPGRGTYPLATYPFDQAIQANWFTAACEFVKRNHMKSIYFYSYTYLSQPQLAPSPNYLHTTALQPRGLAAIERCFKS